MAVSMGLGTGMLNSGYFFNETRSRANELLEVAKIKGKIKMASQVGLSEKSFAMQLSVFWLVFPQKNYGWSFHKKKPIEHVFYRLYTSLRG